MAWEVREIRRNLANVIAASFPVDGIEIDIVDGERALNGDQWSSGRAEVGLVAFKQRFHHPLLFAEHIYEMCRKASDEYGVKRLLIVNYSLEHDKNPRRPLIKYYFDIIPREGTKYDKPDGHFFKSLAALR